MPPLLYRFAALEAFFCARYAGARADLLVTLQKKNPPSKQKEDWTGSDTITI